MGNFIVTGGMHDYKIEQLKKMLEVELRNTDDAGYGANLSHWYKGTAPVKIDRDGLIALIEHYENRNLVERFEEMPIEKTLLHKEEDGGSSKLSPLHMFPESEKIMTDLLSSNGDFKAEGCCTQDSYTYGAYASGESILCWVSDSREESGLEADAEHSVLIPRKSTLEDVYFAWQICYNKVCATISESILLMSQTK